MKAEEAEDSTAAESGHSTPIITVTPSGGGGRGGHRGSGGGGRSRRQSSTSDTKVNFCFVKVLRLNFNLMFFLFLE